EPITGRVVSMVPGKEPELNALYLRSGRFPEPGRDDEVVVTEAFAKARSLALGDRLALLLDGRRHRVTVAGVVLSAADVDTVGGATLLPDDARFGVLWMAEEPLAAALGMRGVYNDFSIGLARDASAADVVDAVDRILAPYGGAGAFDRSLQPSEHFLAQKMQQIATSATVIPAIFLAVAAFLLNVVMTRTVAAERTQIATMKAFGYTSGEIARHYTEFALVLSGAGAALGVMVGAALGRGMLGIYTGYYHFPLLPLTVTGRTIATSVCVTLAAG